MDSKIRLSNECQKLTDAINTGSFREQHSKLFAARQALCWAINPESAASPYQMIMGVESGSETPLAPPPATATHNNARAFIEREVQP